VYNLIEDVLIYAKIRSVMTLNNKYKRPLILCALFLLSFPFYVSQSNLNFRMAFAEVIDPIYRKFDVSVTEENIEEDTTAKDIKEKEQLPFGQKKKLDREPSSYKDGEVIVKFKSSEVKIKDHNQKSKQFLEDFSEGNKLKVKRELSLDNYVVFEITDGKEVKDKVNELKGKYEVESVQPNFRYESSAISTNDTDRAKLWGLDNTGQVVSGTAGSVDADIDAPEAWARTLGTEEVTVSVIDSGVAYNHPDLANMMWDGSSCKDASGNYLGGCSHGYDYEDMDKDPVPESNEHGTHVAGTIGAQRNNSVGILGVAPKARILAIKTGFYSDEIVDGIEFSRQNGAKVINASWGCYSSDQGGSHYVCGTDDEGSNYGDLAMTQAIGSFPGLFVVAAGNGDGDSDNLGENHDSGETLHNYPCDLTLSNIVCVAATDSKNQLATFSDYGATSVDVGAPGVNIYSTVNESYALNQNFNSITAPAVPSDWVKGGTLNKWGTASYNQYFGKVLYGDTYWPYSNNANSTITPPIYNLSSYNGATISFWTICDTEYSTTSWTDYMALEFSSDGGSTYARILQWDEAYLDPYSGGVGNSYYYFDGIPLSGQYLSSGFKFRFRWVTDNSINWYDGCLVDDVQLRRYSNGFDSKYAFMDGTSMATPHVAGLAAYLWSVDPTLTTGELKNIILTSGDSLPSLSGKTVTGKRINMSKALISVYPPVLKQVTAVPVKTLNTIPNYTFSSDKAGTISYEGDCTSTSLNNLAVKGNNTITFNPLSFGTHSNCVIKVTDSYGNIGSLSVSSFTVQSGVLPVLTQVTPIPTPTINTAPSYTFNTTKEGSITYGGPCSSGTVTAEVGDNTITFNALPSGVYTTCTIKVTDLELQNSNTLTVKSFTIDLNPPVLKQVTAVPSITKNSSPNYTFSINEPATLIYEGDCSSVTDTVSTAGNVTVKFNELVEGLHDNCVIKAVDMLGNATPTGLSVNPFTIDVTAPIISEINPVVTPTKDTTPHYTFATTEAGKITYSGGCISSTTSASVGLNDIDFSILKQGTYSLCTIKITDPAGNVSNILPVSTFKIDTTRPTISLVTPVKNPTNDTTPDYIFNTTEAGTITYDGDCLSDTTEAVAGNNTITFNALIDGLHSNCTIQITDAAGNTSRYMDSLGVYYNLPFKVNTFKVDTVKSVLTVVSAVKNPTNDTTPEYKFSTTEAGRIKYFGDCSSLTTSAVAGTNPISFNILSAGTHNNCSINVTDKAGNESDMLNVNEFLIDVTKPVLTRILSVPNPTNDNTPNFLFETTEAGTIIYGPYCKSISTIADVGVNTVTFNTLANGVYSTCTVSVRDSAGNTSVALPIPSFKVDTVKPVLKQVTPIPLSTRDTTPIYTFSSSELGDITYSGDCSSTANKITVVGNLKITFDQLVEGTHDNCTITVTDKAMNSSLPLSVRAFSVDLTSPIISEVTPVTDPTNDTTPDYIITTSEAGKITYAGGCTSTKTSALSGNNTITFSALPAGMYSLCTVKITDAAGNASNILPVTPFRIDLTRPVITRIAAVPATTNDTTPSYTFSTTEGGAITYSGDCISATEEAVKGNNTITFNELGEGAHTNCKLAVTDAAGNISLDHVINSFTIGVGDFPEISLVMPIPLRTKDTTPSFTFNSTKEGRISYKGSCSSTTTNAIVGDNPITFNPLIQGTYTNCTIQVIDSSSNPSNFLVVNGFTIDTTKPVLTVKTAVPTRTGDRTPDFKFNSTEAGSITYAGDCSSVVNAAIVGVNTVTFDELAEGTHSNCTIRVTDDVGNLSAALLVTSFYVDLTGPVLKEVTKVPAVTIDTTPNYTFSTNEAGTITYQGSCSSIKTSASAGNNTITFNTLPYGTYSDCKILVTDKYTNISTPLDVTQFTIQDKILKEVTPVATPTNDNTPEYVFSSSRTGILKYSGGCTSTSGSAVMGDNVITFNALADATYSSCLLKLYNSSSVLLNTLTVSPFTIDTVVPVISEVTAVQSPTEDTTPEYTFSSSEAGDATYSGGCTSETESIQEGNNTITFDELEIGTYSDCKILVEDLAGNSSELLDITPFTIHDVTPPVLTETDPIETPTTDTTPAYTFNSTEAGTISYSGSCSSVTTNAIQGENIITFNELVSGTYSDCKIRVTDAQENESLDLTVSTFVVTSP